MRRIRFSSVCLDFHALCCSSVVWVENFNSNQFISQRSFLFLAQVCKRNLKIVQIAVECLSDCGIWHEVVEVLDQLRSIVVPKLRQFVLKLCPALLDRIEHLFKTSIRSQFIEIFFQTNLACKLEL